MISEDLANKRDDLTKKNDELIKTMKKHKKLDNKVHLASITTVDPSQKLFWMPQKSGGETKKCQV